MNTAKGNTPRSNGGAGSKNAATMPDSVDLGSQAVTDPKQSTPMPVDFEAEIRLRAYELYKQRGCTPGHENEDWLLAEDEVMTRYNQKQTA